VVGGGGSGYAFTSYGGGDSGGVRILFAPASRTRPGTGDPATGGVPRRHGAHVRWSRDAAPSLRKARGRRRLPRTTARRCSRRSRSTWRRTIPRSS